MNCRNAASLPAALTSWACFKVRVRKRSLPPFADTAMRSQGLKKFLSSDHKRIAYNVAKKFFEYTVGQTPDLKQRLDLWAMIPDKAEECRIRELLVGVLVYSTGGQQPGESDNP